MVGFEALESGNCRTHRSGPQPLLLGTPRCQRHRLQALPHGHPHPEGAVPSPQGGDRLPLPLGGARRRSPSRAVSRFSCGRGGTSAPPQGRAHLFPPAPGEGDVPPGINAISEAQVLGSESSTRAGFQRRLWHGCLRRGAPEGWPAALLCQPAACGRGWLR